MPDNETFLSEGFTLLMSDYWVETCFKTKDKSKPFTNSEYTFWTYILGFSTQHTPHKKILLRHKRGHFSYISSHLLSLPLFIVITDTDQWANVFCKCLGTLQYWK